MSGKDKILIEIHKNLTKLIELKTKEYNQQSWTGFYVISFIIFGICLYNYGFIEAILRTIGLIFFLFLLFWWLFAPLSFYITQKIYGYDPDDRVKEIQKQINKKYLYSEFDDINRLNNINSKILNEINAIHQNHQDLLKKEKERKKENIRTIVKYTLCVALVMTVLVFVAISIDRNKQHKSANTSPLTNNYYEQVNILKNRIKNNKIQLMQGIIIPPPNTESIKKVADALEANQTWWGDIVNSEEKTFIYVNNNTNSQIQALKLETYSSYCDAKKDRSELIIAPEYIIQPNSEAIITYTTPKNIIQAHCINIIGVWGVLLH